MNPPSHHRHGGRTQPNVGRRARSSSGEVQLFAFRACPDPTEERVQRHSAGFRQCRDRKECRSGNGAVLDLSYGFDRETSRGGNLDSSSGTPRIAQNPSEAPPAGDLFFGEAGPNHQ
jgi:hypothetical protein